MPVEWCRLCAHTSCEKRNRNSDSEEPKRCQAGYAQTMRVKPWMKNGNKYNFCGEQCPAGTWMTCDTGSPEQCVYPPYLEGEEYLKWVARVELLDSRNGITIPKIRDLSRLTWYPYQDQNDISHCWPCRLAAGMTHYGFRAGEIHTDAAGLTDYADFYCPGKSDPPVDCTRGDDGVTINAGSDMRGPNKQTTCQCLAGYYSSNFENDGITPMYKNQNPSQLKCVACPPGFYCRFRAEQAAPGYSGNASCPIGQQKCPCPINHYCPERSSAPIPCEQISPCGTTAARTQCVKGFQTEPSKCIPCYKCAQMGGNGAPCLNMINILNVTGIPK